MRYTCTCIAINHAHHPETACQNTSNRYGEVCHECRFPRRLPVCRVCGNLIRPKREN